MSSSDRRSLSTPPAYARFRLEAHLHSDAKADPLRFLLFLRREDQPTVYESKILVVPRSWLDASLALQRDPYGPSVAGALDADALGRELGGALFDLYPDSLLRFLEEPMELRVALPEELAWLPWEALANRMPARSATHPVLFGHWSLVRELPAAQTPPPREKMGRRVMLVIGDVAQELVNVWEDLFDLIEALQREDLGTTVELVAGRKFLQLPTRAPIPIAEPLVSFAHLAQRIERFEPDLLHFVGHSRGSLDDLPQGRRQLWLELHEGSAGPIPRAFDPRSDNGRCVLDAARAVDCSVVLFHNCIAREALSRAFLEAGAARVAIGTSGLLSPRQSVASARSFYAALATEGAELLDALRQERKALREDERHRRTAWIPALWTALPTAALPRPVSPRELEDEVLLERYCALVVEQHEALRGEWERSFGLVLAKSYVPVEVTEGRAAQRAGEACESTDQLTYDTQDPAKPRGAFRELLQQSIAENVLLHTLGGGPGSGKTTTLCYHVRDEAAQRERTHVPIYVELATWLAEQEGQLDLGAWLEQHFALPGLQGALERRAARGGVLVCWDGYDELSVEQRERFVKAAPWKRAPWSTTPIVIGTRRYLSSQRFVGAGWRHLDMCALTPALATSLLQKLLLLNTKTKPRCAELLALWTPLWQSNGPRFWRELARVPLFVALIALLATRVKDPQKIRERGFFFEQVLHALWFQVHRQVEDEEEDAEMPAEHLALLRELALEMSLRRTRDLDVEELRERKLRSLLDPIAERSLIFVKRDSDPEAPWRFWHRSFQEALAAEELWRRFVVPHDGHLEAASEALVTFLEKRVPALKDGATWMPDAERVANLTREVRSTWAADIGPNNGIVRNELEQEVLSRIDPEGPDYDEFRPIWARQASARERGDWDGFDHVVGEEKGALVARLLGPMRARDEEQEYLIEPLALLAERARSQRGLGAALLRRFASNAWPLVYGAFDRLESLECATLLAGFERSPSPRAQIDVLERWSYALLPSERAQAAEALEKLGLAPGFSKDLDLRAALVDAVRRLEVDHPVPEALPGPRESALLRAFYPVPSHTACEHLREELSDFFADGQGRRVRRWCLLEAGRYPIGSPVDCEHHYPNERPFEAELTRPLWLAATSVTCRLFALFQPEHGTWWRDRRAVADPSLPDRAPVTAVSYFQARAFCRWLALHGADELERRVGRAVVPRLPTEVEREAATRAGADPRWRYWSGDEESDLARVGWYLGNKPDKKRDAEPQLVAGLEPNPLGLYDVHGNLWEWCLDWSGAYPEGSAIDARGPSRGRGRVLRGGGYGSDAVVCRSADRNAFQPSERNGGIGFRVALAPAPELGGP